MSLTFGARAAPSTATTPHHQDDGLDFGGYPQPPTVPPDPTGDDWRGPQGPMGPPGPAGVSGATTVADTAPGAPAQGALWFDSISTQLFIGYNDGNSAQWVAANNTAGLSDALSDGTTYGRRNGTWTPIVAGGVASWNTRTGAVTMSSSDVTTALTFTPYNATNPAGYISGNQTVTLSGDVTGSGATAITAALATVNANVGSFTNAAITVNAKGLVTAAANGTAGTVVTVSDAPPTLTNGALWFDSVGTQLYIGYNDGTSSQWVLAVNGSGAPISYAQLPVEVQQLPISFPFAGVPAASARVNVPMVMTVTVPANLTGATVYDTTKTTASATFTVSKISGGSTTTLGTVVITSTSNTSATLSGAGGTLNAGDVLQITAPSTPDATLADLGITLLCARV